MFQEIQSKMLDLVKAKEYYSDPISHLLMSDMQSIALHERKIWIESKEVARLRKTRNHHNSCAGDNSKSEPPDPFPNSEVKPLSADGSVELSMWE